MAPKKRCSSITKGNRWKKGSVWNVGPRSWAGQTKNSATITAATPITTNLIRTVKTSCGTSTIAYEKITGCWTVLNLRTVKQRPQKPD
jgi:hypothetical protein